MRIISGEFGGRRINAKVPPNTRPTQDNVRESIFNILNNFVEFDSLQVADICAGTGMMGFEALSRGAAHCHFFEKAPRSCRLIAEIADQLGISSDNYNILSGDANKALTKLPANSYDLVFFDPPYASMISNSIINIIASRKIMTDGGIVCAEHATREALLIPGAAKLLKSRKFGDTIVDYLCFEV